MLIMYDFDVLQSDIYLNPTATHVFGISYDSQSTPNSSERVGSDKERQEEGRKNLTFGLGFKPGTSHTVS